MSDDSQDSHDNQPHENLSTSADKPDHRLAYIGLAITVLPFFIAALRIYVVANGNPSVIKSLGATLNIQSLLLGTYLGIIPILLLFGAVSLMLHAAYAEYAKKRDQWQRIGIGMLLVAFSAILLDLNEAKALALYAAILLISLLIADATGLIIRRRMVARRALSGKRIPPLGISDSAAARIGYTPSEKELKRNRIARKFLRGGRYLTQGGLALLLLVQILFPPGMWLPTESIAIRSQKTAVIGFVLEEKDDRITILRRDGLGVQHFHVSDIVSRQPCDDRIKKDPVFVRLFDSSVKTDRIPVCRKLE